MTEETGRQYTVEDPDTGEPIVLTEYQQYVPGTPVWAESEDGEIITTMSFGIQKFWASDPIKAEGNTDAVLPDGFELTENPVVG